jgi:hypothetical protein
MFKDRQTIDCTAASTSEYTKIWLATAYKTFKKYPALKLNKWYFCDRFTSTENPYFLSYE